MMETLSYDDVLLVPKYSDIESRSQISLDSNLGAGLEFRTPIIASPMDTVSGLDMALTLSRLGGIAIIHRYNSIEEQAAIVREVKNRGERVGGAVGATGDFLDRVHALYRAGVDFICIDVAHGHHLNVYSAIRTIRDHYGPSMHIMAGNVATSEAYEALQAWGANSIRVGIGGGCFLPNTRVNTADGYKNIQDIKIGEMVFTHDGTLKKVVDTMAFDRNEEIVSINNIECTKNHEFYIVEKEKAHLVNEDNIHEHAKWIEAGLLDKDKHLLIELE